MRPIEQKAFDRPANEATMDACGMRQDKESRCRWPGRGRRAGLSRARLVLSGTPWLLYLFLLVNGGLGIRFGVHWDEDLFMTQAARASAAGSLLPHDYFYPSFCFDLVYALARLYRAFGGAGDTAAPVSGGDFGICIRLAFMAISSLSVVWVYWLALKAGKRYLPALAAGLALCSSFEFSYHSRWGVSDCLAAQFAILSTAILFFDGSRVRKLIGSALVAGVAAGTKYTAGIVVLSILLYIILGMARRTATWKTVLGELALLAAFLGLGFFITTPGAVFDLVQFVGDVSLQKNVYAYGFFGHTVEAGWPHFTKICEYAGLVLFGKQPWIAGAICLLALVGTGAAVVRRQWLLAGLFGVMLAYGLYVSTYRVMFVRNLMYLPPFLAVLAGLGTGFLARIPRRPGMRRAVWVALLAPSLLGCVLVARASLTIYHKDRLDFSRELKSYLAGQSGREFICSPKVRALLGLPRGEEVKHPENATFLFFKSEKSWQSYTANRRGQFEKVIGIEDVNFDYYPTENGADRIVIRKYSPSEDAELLTGP
jgi:hypothetical protein